MQVEATNTGNAQTLFLFPPISIRQGQYIGLYNPSGRLNIARSVGSDNGYWSLEDGDSNYKYVDAKNSPGNFKGTLNLQARIACSVPSDDALPIWTQFTREKTCILTPGLEWDTRNDETCQEFWPSGRAGHSLVQDDHLLYMFGGYRTFFPYPRTDGAGTAPGTSASAKSGGQFGFTPYPTFPYFLNDLWQYNMKTKRWIEIQPASTVNPKGRMHHVMIRSTNILLMYGGYNNNFYFDDTWQFNTTSGHWLEKESYVWPTYPSSCSNDMAPNNANFSVWGQPTRSYWL